MVFELGRPSLDVFLPLPLTRRGPSYTCGMLSKEMAGADLDVHILTPRMRSFAVGPAEVVESLPFWARYVPFRWVKGRALANFDNRYLDQVRSRSGTPRGAYIWPDTGVETIQALRQDGVVVFREMINCHQGMAKIILDDAYARFGQSPAHGITDSLARSEQETLEAVDYIFCPNQGVEQSLLQRGFPTAKLLPSSYGWEPARFAGSHRLLEPSDGMTLVFAGSVGVRKGCHLLLDYWARSGIRGRLVLAGKIEPVIREKFGHLLARSDVVTLNFVADMGALYRSADIFVFPTLEEGGPQVTYEACGCALPVVTTPMGAGRIVRHGIEGYVLDPYDGESWIAALRELAEDQDRRVAMAQAARARAERFHWGNVATQRKRLILERLLRLKATPQAEVTFARVAT